MTPQEKAEQLVLTFGSIKLASEAVNQIEEALKDYGSAGNIHHVDQEFRFWEKVRYQINKLNIGL